MCGYVGDNGDGKDEHNDDRFCTNGYDEDRKHITPCDLHRLFYPAKVEVRDHNAGDCTRDEEQHSILSPSERIEPRPEIEQMDYGARVYMSEDAVFDAPENVPLCS